MLYSTKTKTVYAICIYIYMKWEVTAATDVPQNLNLSRCFKQPEVHSDYCTDLNGFLLVFKISKFFNRTETKYRQCTICIYFIQKYIYNVHCNRLYTNPTYCSYKSKSKCSVLISFQGETKPNAPK